MKYKMGMKKDKERMGMMYGGTRTKAMSGGMYGRKSAKHGGPHNNMDRICMNIGGAMEVAKPN